MFIVSWISMKRMFVQGPIAGGEMVKTIGFQWVMRIIGLMNVGYCPFLIYLSLERRKLLTQQDEKRDYETFQKSVARYERFRDSDDDLWYPNGFHQLPRLTSILYNSTRMDRRHLVSVKVIQSFDQKFKLYGKRRTRTLFRDKWMPNIKHLLKFRLQFLKNDILYHFCQDQKVIKWFKSNESFKKVKKNSSQTLFHKSESCIRLCDLIYC